MYFLTVNGGYAHASQRGAPYKESYRIKTAIMIFRNVDEHYYHQKKYEPVPFLIMKKCLASRLMCTIFRNQKQDNYN